MKKITVAIATLLCGLNAYPAGAAPQQGQPTVTLNTPTQGAIFISGSTQNVDPSRFKIVVYANTNQWYVQPLTAAPFTNIQPDGTWSTRTNPWSYLVVIVVDPTVYTPQNIEVNNPAFDPGVIAWTMYPGPAAISFSNYLWGIKITGNQPGYQFDPGHNFWSNDPSVVSVQPDGLHLTIVQLGGNWQSAEVYLTKSLGYGTYTVQIASPLDHLDPSTVAAPMFIYLNNLSAEFDNEYSGAGGLIPPPNNAHFVAQPYTTPSNIFAYIQPATSKFSSQMEWRADHVTFRTWNGWASIPAPSDVIQEWLYTGPNNFAPGQEQVHINLWLNNAAPVNGVGDTMVIKSFNFQSLVYAPVTANPSSLAFSATYSGTTPAAQTTGVTSANVGVDFVASPDSPWLTVQTSISTTPSTVTASVLPGTLTPGTYHGNVTLTSGTNTTLVPVTMAIAESGSLCDVYNNGTINIAGVQKIINEALGLENPANHLNHSTTVNVVDVEIIINAVLNRGCTAH